MLKRITFLAMAIGTGMLLGCPPSGSVVSTDAATQADGPVTAAAVVKPLVVTLRLPRSRFAVGDEVPVTMEVTNRGAESVCFRRRTSAPYRIQLLRRSETGWTAIKTYPASAAMVLREWTLPAGQSRTFETRLPVEPDWPTYENLRLRVRLTGRARLAPFVHIEVVR